jgi:hypothetical protein
MAEERVRYSVVLLTANHSIAGELLFRGQRLSDFLNDRRETAVSLLDASVARLDEPGKILQKHPAAVVPKLWVVAAFEPPQTAIPPGHRFSGYVKKEAHDVFLVMEGMEVRGTLHTAGDLDLRRVLTVPEHTFLPITKAVVMLESNRKYIIEQDAIMVNSARIKYIGKSGPRIPSP